MGALQGIDLGPEHSPRIAEENAVLASTPGTGKSLTHSYAFRSRDAAKLSLSRPARNAAIP